MSSIHETAYPRFKPDLSQRELEDIYTPTNKERIFSQRNAHTAVARLALMVLLKTVQRLGYFVKLAEVPRPIISHIAKCMGRGQEHNAGYTPMNNTAHGIGYWS